MLRQRRASTPQGSSGPHEFVPPHDPRLGLAFAAGAGQEGQLSSSGALLVAGATVREQRCAMTGCGKLREDPIHWPQE